MNFFKMLFLNLNSKLYLNHQEDLDEMDSWDLYYAFSEWMNEFIHIWHYIEIMEFQNHDVEKNHYLIQKNVDTQAIDTDVGALFDSLEEDQLDEDDDYSAHFEIEQKVEEILFDQIKHFAEQKQLTLLVIFRENPYWLVVPSQDELRLQRIIDEFNQCFCQDGDLTMDVY